MLNRADSGKLQRTWQAISQAFMAFLSVPTLLILGFVGAALATYILDQDIPTLLSPVRHWLQEHAFRNGAATSQLLGTIAGGLFTVTSITFSLLLLAVQQSATNLTSQVFDQFLRRGLNQIFLGYFVGLTLYTLLILATVNKPHNPVLGATLDLVLVLAALYLLILILYTTINQIRPSQVVESTHDLTLRARRAQLPLLRQTRRRSLCAHPVQSTFTAPRYGYLTDVHLAPLRAALQGTDAEVEILHTMGYFFAYGEVIAQVRAPDRASAEPICQALKTVLQLQPTRNLRNDPAFGVEQLEVIGWTSISTAKQNLAPGQLVIHLLHDLLAHWLEEDPSDGQSPLAVIYPDRLPSQVLDVYESLGSITRLSHQYPVLVQIACSLAALYPDLPTHLRDHANQVIRGTLPAVRQQTPARSLVDAYCQLSACLRQYDAPDLASQIDATVRHIQAQGEGTGNGS